MVPDATWAAVYLIRRHHHLIHQEGQPLVSRGCYHTEWVFGRTCPDVVKFVADRPCCAVFLVEKDWFEEHEGYYSRDNHTQLSNPKAFTAARSTRPDTNKFPAGFVRNAAS